MSSQEIQDRRLGDRTDRKGQVSEAASSDAALPDLSDRVYARSEDELKQLAEDLETERVQRAERIKLTLAEPAKARVRVEAVMPLDDEL